MIFRAIRATFRPCDEVLDREDLRRELQLDPLILVQRLYRWHILLKALKLLMALVV
jgi:hypothetical protein